MSMLDDQTSSPPELAAGLDDGDPSLSNAQKLLLVLLLGTQFMLAIDFSILNVALPAVGQGLDFSPENLQWVATAFALPAAGFTLLFGRIGDLFGRRRLFFAGLVLLAAGSLLGGLAQSPSILLTARVVQGFAAAMATPTALSLLTTAFPEGPLRQRALGLNGALLSGGFTAGALVGGLLTDVLSWRWAFLVNVPVALLILAFASRVVRAGVVAHRPSLDVPGAVTVTAGLLSLVYGLSSAGVEGWAAPRALVPLAAAAVLLVAFWVIESRTAEPLASVRILRRPSVKWGNLGGFLVFSMGSGVVFLMTLYLHTALGYSPLMTGLAFGVPGLAAVGAGIVAPRVLGRLGTTRALVTGLCVQAAAFAPLVLLGTSRAYLVLLLATLLVGFFGHVTAIVAYTVTATSGLPDDEQGLATGLSTLTQQVAITLGIPIASTIATARTHALGAGGIDAFLAGIHTAVCVDVVVTLLGAALIGRQLSARARTRAPSAV